MMVAKIIRHRHKNLYYINDDLKTVEERDYYKIVFSQPYEYNLWLQWVKDNKGEYKWDKAALLQDGKMPELKIFEGQEPCYCSIMQYYLLHVAGYEFHSALSPYKGEIYTKPDKPIDN